MAITIFAFLLPFLSHVLASPTGYDKRQDSAFHPAPDSIPTCVGWVQASDGDTCFSLWNSADTSASFNDFLAWNPPLQTDCNDVVSGFSYCISAPSPLTTQTPASTSSTLITRQTPPTTDDFPPTPPQLKCIPADGNPPTAPGGTPLLNLVSQACGIIANDGSGSKFLDTNGGKSYDAYLSTEGRTRQFSLRIRIGGFQVSTGFCEQQLAYVVYGCGDNRNTGGCTYTSDYNLESCIFP